MPPDELGREDQSVLIQQLQGQVLKLQRDLRFEKDPAKVRQYIKCETVLASQCLGGLRGIRLHVGAIDGVSRKCFSKAEPIGW